MAKCRLVLQFDGQERISDELLVGAGSSEPDEFTLVGAVATEKAKEVREPTITYQARMRDGLIA